MSSDPATSAAIDRLVDQLVCDESLALQWVRLLAQNMHHIEERVAAAAPHLRAAVEKTMSLEEYIQSALTASSAHLEPADSCLVSRLEAALASDDDDTLVLSTGQQLSSASIVALLPCIHTWLVETTIELDDQLAKRGSPTPASDLGAELKRMRIACAILNSGLQNVGVGGHGPTFASRGLRCTLRNITVDIANAIDTIAAAIHAGLPPAAAEQLPGVARALSLTLHRIRAMLGGPDNVV